MAEEHEIVLEDDHKYVAVTAPGGLAQHGAICVLEIGRHFMAPADGKAHLYPLNEENVRALIAHLQARLPQ